MRFMPQRKPYNSRPALTSFLEDAQMHGFARLIAALTLGALAAPPLSAQTPADLADVCKVLGDAKPGQWASFDGAGSAGVGKLRLAVVGWESVTVPAGTFRALHVTTGDGGELWASRDVPFGVVKTHGKQGDLALTGRGADAKSSIAEKPMEMPGMAMPKD